MFFASGFEKRLSVPYGIDEIVIVFSVGTEEAGTEIYMAAGEKGGTPRNRIGRSTIAHVHDGRGDNVVEIVVDDRAVGEIGYSSCQREYGSSGIGKLAVPTI